MALRYSTGLRNRLFGIAPVDVLPATTENTFAAATTGWTGVAGTLSVDTARLKCTNDGAAISYAYATVTCVVGRKYYVSYDYVKGTGDNGFVSVGTDSTTNRAATAKSQTHTANASGLLMFTATATTHYVCLETADTTSADTHMWDNVYVYEANNSLAELFRGGSIKIYTGTQPTEADDPSTGSTLLVTINNGGSGVTFNDTASGVISKATAETWSGVCAATGTAGWARLVRADDTDADSTTEIRLDMSVATSGANLNFTSTAFTSGSTQTISTFSLTFPAA